MNLALMPVSETVLLSKPNGNGDTMREPDTPENTTDVHIPKLGDSVQVGKYFVCSSVKFGATALCAAFDGSGTSAAPISTQIISAQRFVGFFLLALKENDHPNLSIALFYVAHDIHLYMVRIQISKLFTTRRSRLAQTSTASAQKFAKNAGVSRPTFVTRWR